MGLDQTEVGGELGEIIQTTAALIVGIAVGYVWRDRISKARHAKVRKRSERRKQADERATFDVPPHWRATVMGLLARRRH
jgi:hypothetical protein